MTLNSVCSLGVVLAKAQLKVNLISKKIADEQSAEWLKF